MEQPKFLCGVDDEQIVTFNEKSYDILISLTKYNH